MASPDNLRTRFEPPPPFPEGEVLRAEVRAFLAEHLPRRAITEGVGSWGGSNREFSRKMGARGWIGMTWPKQYGGHERSALERYVVLEEMLAAGAPVSGHWVADRQSGPLILRFGTEEQKQAILPRIAAGECSFCIGMSEPDSGSDLASVRTRAADGAKAAVAVNGTKVWTSNAHRSELHDPARAHRAEAGEQRHGGLTQFLVDLKRRRASRSARSTTSPASTISTRSCSTDVFLPDDSVLGEVGSGWQQVTSELAFERCGPERFLSAFYAAGRTDRARSGPSPRTRAPHRARPLRRASSRRCGACRARSPACCRRARIRRQQAALVKDLGTTLEQEIPEIARQLIDAEPDRESTRDFVEVLAHTMMHAPSFTIRGGTREILRGMIARGLGLR